MTRQEFLEKANKGIVSIEGVNLEIEIRPDKDGDDFISIYMHPITELHTPTYLGQKWLKYTSESEFYSFESEIKKHRETAEQFYKKAKRVVKATIKDGYIKILDYPENVRKDWSFYEDEEEKENAIKRYIRCAHPVRFIGNKKTEFCALGDFTVDIDGHLYIPHYSYWLGCTYYIADDYILNTTNNIAGERQ